MLNFGYSNATVDTAIDNAAKTLQTDQRKKYLQDAMKTAMDDVAIVPLFIPTYKFGLAKDIIWNPLPNRQIYIFDMAGKSTTQ
jgi:peptide/nickel transport system substrate-binding protein